MRDRARAYTQQTAKMPPSDRTDGKRIYDLWSGSKGHSLLSRGIIRPYKQGIKSRKGGGYKTHKQLSLSHLRLKLLIGFLAGTLASGLNMLSLIKDWPWTNQKGLYSEITNTKPSVHFRRFTTVSLNHQSLAAWNANSFALFSHLGRRGLRCKEWNHALA